MEMPYFHLFNLYCFANGLFFVSNTEAGLRGSRTSYRKLEKESEVFLIHFIVGYYMIIYIANPY